MTLYDLVNSYTDPPAILDGAIPNTGDPITFSVLANPPGVSGAITSLPILIIDTDKVGHPELMLVTSVTSLDWTASRLFGASNPGSFQSHADGSYIYLPTMAEMIDWDTLLNKPSWTAGDGNAAHFLDGTLNYSTPPSGSLTLIDTKTPTGTNVDFTSIPSTYKNLEIRWVAQGTDAAVSTISLQLNADTAAHYDYVRNLFTNASTLSGGGNALAATSAECGIITKSGLTHYPDSGTILIPRYNDTTFYKTYHGDCSYIEAQSAGNLFGYFVKGWWRDTSAINEVKITLSAGNFATGSIFELWGLS